MRAGRDDNIVENMAAAAELGVALIEQPLPAGKDEILGKIAHPVPICADESAHGADDLHTLVGRYDAINIKLDKTGGLTEALRCATRPRAWFWIMVGCMVGTSLAMAPACYWRRTPILSISMVRCCWRATVPGACRTRLAGVTARAGALGLTRPRARSAQSRPGDADIAKNPARRSGRRAARIAASPSP